MKIENELNPKEMEQEQSLPPIEEEDNDITKTSEELEKKSFSEYYDDVDKQHAEILKRVSQMCRSGNKEVNRQFTDLTKINAIRELVQDTEYKELYIGTASIWYKGDIQKTAEHNDIYLVSTHCDMVPNITTCSSELSDDGYYSGTYDNCGTNGAAVILMREADLPDNVVFTFTADEETGHCQGANDTISYFNKCNIDPICIALDVTYEGYDEGLLASIENCVKDKPFLKQLASAALETEVENGESFTFVRKSKKAFPENLPQKYMNATMGMYDEAMKYGELHKRAFSLCLPCDGNMHSNIGVNVRQPVFEGYIHTLKGLLYQFTKTHSEMIPIIQYEKNILLERTKELVEYEEATKPKYTYSSYGQSFGEYGGGYFYDSGNGELTDFYPISDEFDESDVEELIYSDIECYGEDKKGFIHDKLALLCPDLYNEYHKMKEMLAHKFNEYQEMMDEMAEDMNEYHTDEVADDYYGYVEDLDYD